MEDKYSQSFSFHILKFHDDVTKCIKTNAVHQNQQQETEMHLLPY